MSRISQIILPYIFQEGNKAYAAQVMANFYAVLNTLNSIVLQDMPADDLVSVLQTLSTKINNAVTKNEQGNAAQIKFDDGETMQQKLDGGEFNGVDAFSVMNHMYKLFVDSADGHLKACLPSDEMAPPLSIDERGHLIYTISDEVIPTGAVVYDLGNVRGEKGETGAAGGMQASVYDPHEHKKDIFAAIADTATPKEARLTAVAGSWNSDTKIIKLLSSLITNANHFDVDTAYDVTVDEQEAWVAAKAKVVAQENGSFDLKAFGAVPTMDIPLTVRVYG